MVAIPNLPFAGATGARRVAIYVLDPTLTTPLQPIILDVIPIDSLSPLTVNFNTAQAVSRTHRWTITQNAVLNFGNVTVNAHKEPETASISGIIDPTPANIPFLTTTAPTFGLFRKDLVAKNIIIAIAGQRRPVLVLTPDWTMARAWIESIVETQNEGDGEVTHLSINFVEAIIPSAFLVGAQDSAAMTGGADQTTNAGAQGGSAVETPTALAGGGLG